LNIFSKIEVLDKYAVSSILKVKEEINCVFEVLYQEFWEPYITKKKYKHYQCTSLLSIGNSKNVKYAIGLNIGVILIVNFLFEKIEEYILPRETSVKSKFATLLSIRMIKKINKLLLVFIHGNDSIALLNLNKHTIKRNF